MRIRLHLSGEAQRKCRLPFQGADHVVTDGKCPACGAHPFGVRGLGKRITSHDTYAADAVGTCCGKPVGELRVTLSTLFGLDEDERVLSGPWKVY
jgi:hypothetical protein